MALAKTSSVVNGVDTLVLFLTSQFFPLYRMLAEGLSSAVFIMLTYVFFYSRFLQGPIMKECWIPPEGLSVSTEVMA